MFTLQCVHWPQSGLLLKCSEASREETIYPKKLPVPLTAHWKHRSTRKLLHHMPCSPNLASGDFSPLLQNEIQVEGSLFGCDAHQCAHTGGQNGTSREESKHWKSRGTSTWRDMGAAHVQLHIMDSLNWRFSVKYITIKINHHLCVQVMFYNPRIKDFR